MRAAVAVLILGALALLLQVQERNQDGFQPMRQGAMDLDIRLLSQAGPSLEACATGGRMMAPGIQIGARFWKTVNKKRGGLALARIGPHGISTGVRYFELRKGDQELVLLELRAFLDDTPIGSWLALTALDSLAEGGLAQRGLTDLLDELGAREHPIGQAGASWAMLTQRTSADSWSAVDEVLEPDGCAELWWTISG